EVDLGRGIGLNDGEGGARRLTRQPSRLQHRARERRLARAEIARQQHDIARNQRRADRLAKALGVGQIIAARKIAHAPRGRLTRTSVPWPFSLRTSMVPPCAATSWRASARPMPPLGVPARSPRVTAATA